MAFIGKEIFTEYKKAKAQFSDFDTWIAEAIREEYGSEFVAPLMAAKICKTSRLPWENVEVFENIVLVMNGREALPGVDQDVSVKEIAFAVAVLKKEFPDDEFKDALSLAPADSVSLEFSLPFAELSVFVEMLESTCDSESTLEELLSLAVQPAKTEIISTKTNKILCNLQILIFIINLPSQINYVFILLYWTFRQISTLTLKHSRKTLY